MKIWQNHETYETMNERNERGGARRHHIHTLAHLLRDSWVGHPTEPQPQATRGRPLLIIRRSGQMSEDVSDDGGQTPAIDERLVSLLTNWGPSSTDIESDQYTRLLHVDPREVERQSAGLYALRRSLDAAGRKAKAEEYKTLANKQFGKEAWRVALVGYLAGCWLLRADTEDPRCPKLLTNHLSDLEEAAAALGKMSAAGKPAAVAAPKEVLATEKHSLEQSPTPQTDATRATTVVKAEEKPSPPPTATSEVPVLIQPPGQPAVQETQDNGTPALRESLLLNLAAAALKLSEWRLASTACEHVLCINPTHPKALWRLAKAQEGDGNLTEAIGTASRLVKADCMNREATQLLEQMKKRKAKYGKMFGSFVERAHAEGDTLYTAKEQARDVTKAMETGFIKCMARPYGEEDPLQVAENATTDREREAAAEWVAMQKGERGGVSGPLVVRDDSDDDEELEPPRVTAGEHLEAVRKEFHMRQLAREPMTDDDKTMYRVLGKAYRQTRDMREEGVRQSLPRNVLETYVDP